MGLLVGEALSGIGGPPTNNTYTYYNNAISTLANVDFEVQSGQLLGCCNMMKAHIPTQTRLHL